MWAKDFKAPSHHHGEVIAWEMAKYKKNQERCAWPKYQNDKCKCKCNFSTIQFTDFLLIFKKRQNAVLSFAQLSIIRVLRDLDE